MLALEYKKDVLSYPSSEYCFSPSKIFPEYPFSSGTLSQKDNTVYDMIRELFKIAELDFANFGSGSWNPLGEFIYPGATVLLKPNWVENKNKNNIDDSLSCLVTNPSVVRAVIDYAIIALKGKGRIILADAPMQGCDLSELFRITGYDKLFHFYKEQNIDIEIYDLRKYSVTQKYKGVISQPKMTENSSGSVLVDLGSRSMHSEKDNQNPHYKVEDYLMNTTKEYHSKGVHRYEINKHVLEADIIINLPKPKTHRLAGITAAMKNFVGITYDKACLPHRIEGDIESGSGDAYKKRSFFKKQMSFFNERRTANAIQGRSNSAYVDALLMKGSYLLGSISSGDKYRIGSWYGNDTIWRTAVDLNNIVMHCDKNGVYHDEIIRKVISIGDMIISGEKEGPVGPTPKALGILLMSDNQLAFDATVCHIMGFFKRKLPMFYNEEVLELFGFPNVKKLEETLVSSNIKALNHKLDEIRFPEKWHFEPHPCWKGYIEENSLE